MGADLVGVRRVVEWKTRRFPLNVVSMIGPRRRRDSEELATTNSLTFLLGEDLPVGAKVILDSTSSGLRIQEDIELHGPFDGWSGWPFG